MIRYKSRIYRAIECAALSAIVLCLLGASDPASRYKELGHRLMCVCTCNQILLECNHVGCTYSDRMDNELMAAVQRGDSDSLVEQAFVQNYGPTVLAAPPMTGFDRTAWIFPIAALFVGFGMVVMLVRAWKNRPAPVLAGGLPPVRGNDRDRLREQAGRETEL